jgi:hypothetical protein
VAASRRGRTRDTETEGGGVKVIDNGGEVNHDELEEEDGGSVLWIGDVVAVRSKGGVVAAACSKAGDKAVACSIAGIEDSRQRWRRRQAAAQ